MLICPDCKEYIKELDCLKCKWHSISDISDQILDFMGTKDLNDPVFKLYLQNYDKICYDDLNQSIMSQKYLNNLAISMVKNLDDLKNKKICDIGSGQGFLIKNLLKEGATNLTAVDICNQYLNTLPSSVRCIRANAENLPFEEEFDIIIATDILEHVFNVGSFLYCINKALKPNGIIYIRVPYKESLMSYSPHLGCSYRFVHLRNFNESLLKQTILSAGLKPLNLYYDGFWSKSPNNFWTRNSALKKIYQSKISNFLLKLAKDEENITLWPSWFNKLFMRSYELTIKATK